MQAEQLKLLVMDALEDIKAEDITILDVTGMTDVTDYMIIATGKTSRQVKALANEVVVKAKASGIMPLGVEGEDIGEWALVDLGDVIAHFHKGRIVKKMLKRHRQTVNETEITRCWPKNAKVGQ